LTPPISAPSVEKRHLVSSGERGLDDVPAKEDGSTED